MLSTDDVVGLTSERGVPKKPGETSFQQKLRHFSMSDPTWLKGSVQLSRHSTERGRWMTKSTTHARAFTGRIAATGTSPIETICRAVVQRRR